MYVFYGHWLPGTGSVLDVGLDCVRVSEGVFRVKVAAYSPPVKRFAHVQTTLDSPWSTETTVTVVATCATHGFACSRCLEDCVDVEISVTTPRWVVVVSEGDDGSFAIKTWRFPKCETLEEAKRTPFNGVLADAGFFLQVMAEAQ